MRPGQSCRQNELQTLDDAYARRIGRHSQILLVEGEAGIGKTTLVERFLSALPESRILRAPGDESESHVPFAMADRLLRRDGRSTDALRSGRHVVPGRRQRAGGQTGQGYLCLVHGEDRTAKVLQRWLEEGADRT